MGFNEAAGIPRGRPKSARHGVSSFPEGASMRPRVFPAEDVRALAIGVRQIKASMRPRVFPAEDI